MSLVTEDLKRNENPPKQYRYRERGNRPYFQCLEDYFIERMMFHPNVDIDINTAGGRSRPRILPKRKCWSC